MKKKRVLIGLAIIIVCFFLVLILNLIIQTAPFAEKVAVLDITGVISQSDAHIKLIHTYRDDPSIKALVIRLNTPGGSVAPVQEIHSELKKLEKPVVASMGGTAASGGYYIACAADTVVSNPGTLTGSIGVIMQFIQMGGLYEKVGLKRQVIKSGEFKDTGSALRDLTEAEQAVLQSTVDDVYNQFVDAIFESRQTHLTRSELLELADGRIFSGKQALNHKLVDKLGNLQDAIQIAAELGNVEGTPKVVRQQRKQSLLEQLIGIKRSSRFNEVLSLPGITFRYELSLGD